MNSTEFGSTKHRRPDFKSVLKSPVVLFAVYLMILVFAVEGTAGWIYKTAVPSMGKRNVEILLGNIAPERALNERPHPYMLWENNPGFVSDSGIRQINGQGYRNEHDFSQLPDPETLRILCLGGSTTYGYMLEKPSDAWPSQLEGLLNARIKQLSGGRFQGVEVMNGGLLYGLSPEFLLHYLVRDRNYRPQLVIIHTGGNDLGPLLYDDYHPEYTHFRPGWGGAVDRLRPGESFLLRHSSFFRTLYAFWLRDGVALPHLIKQSKDTAYALPVEGYVENVRRNEPVGFERYTELLVRNVLDDGATPVLFSFSFAPDAIFKETASGAAQRAAFTKKIRPASLLALEKHRAVMKRLATKYKIPYFELPEGAIPLKFFLDHCHLSKEGEGIKADFVSEFTSRLIVSDLGFTASTLVRQGGGERET